jgi:hypothetical protein
MPLKYLTRHATNPHQQPYKAWQWSSLPPNDFASHAHMVKRAPKNPCKGCAMVKRSPKNHYKALVMVKHAPFKRVQGMHQCQTSTQKPM